MAYDISRNERLSPSGGKEAGWNRGSLDAFVLAGKYGTWP